MLPLHQSPGRQDCRRWTTGLAGTRMLRVCPRALDAHWRVCTSGISMPVTPLASTSAFACRLLARACRGHRTPYDRRRKGPARAKARMAAGRGEISRRAHGNCDDKHKPIPPPASAQGAQAQPCPCGAPCPHGARGAGRGLADRSDGERADGRVHRDRDRHGLQRRRPHHGRRAHARPGGPGGRAVPGGDAQRLRGHARHDREGQRDRQRTRLHADDRRPEVHDLPERRMDPRQQPERELQRLQQRTLRPGRELPPNRHVRRSGISSKSRNDRR